MAERYRKQGLEVHWDPAVVDWLIDLQQVTDGLSLERLIDDKISAAIIPYLPETSGKEVTKIQLRYENGALRVETETW